VARSHVKEKNYLMSSKPEAGEWEAREDDSLDLQHGYEPGEDTEAASNQSTIDGDPVLNYMGRDDGTLNSAEAIAQRNAGIGSPDLLQASNPQGSSVQLLEDALSADGTSSLPGDTPSVQVLSAYSI
jgi:hypothetical protein